MLKHPFTCIVNGPSGCGKTIFTLKIVQQADTIIDPPPREIFWYYSPGLYQQKFDAYDSVKFREGIPDINDFDGNRSTLIIVDDAMHEVNEGMSQIFTKGCHHKNLSVIFLTQNIFHNSTHTRTMNLNCHYLCLFKNPRDATQISYIGRQMYPNKSRFLTEAFIDATSKPFTYLFLDLKPDTDDNLRVRSNIFPGEINIVYLPK